MALIVFVAAVHGLADSRLVRKEPSDLLLDRSYRFVAALENSEGNYGFWKIPDTIPSSLRIATMAAEDRRFNSHCGVDLSSIGRAVVNNYFRRTGYSGASTVAMQVARLQHGGNSGWYFKIHDAVSALGITLLYGRDAVLRHYLTVAPYGNRISGAACASRRYFHKPLDDLSLAEASLLAALPKAPSKMNLFRKNGFALSKRRAALIINRAFNYGWISKQSRDESLAELSTFIQPKKQLRTKSSYHFINACGKKLVSENTGGGEIRTTLDLKLQDTVTSILDRAAPQLFESYAFNAAAMVVDIETGHVLSYIGSIDYNSSAGGAIDCASIKRSTGSLLKPFIYAAGMEWLGYTSSTVLTDLGFDFGTGRNSFIPENFDRKYQGPVLYKNALANSRNIPAVEVLKALGVDMFYEKCIALGLTQNNGRAQYYGLGLSIGGLYCSLQEICEAYLSLADNGIRRKLVWTIDNADTTKQTGRQVIQGDVAMQIRRFLSDPAARLPSFPRGGNLEYPFAVAVKTGTSEGFRDSWCCGMSDKYLVGVWIGNTDFSATNKLSGYAGAAPIVKHILLSLHNDRAGGLNDLEFSPPYGYIPVTICKLTGKRADKFTPYTTTEYYRAGTEPIEYSTVQQVLPVDKRNKLLITPGCRAPVEYRRFIVLDPEYCDWARSQGLELPPERYSPFCSDIPVVDKYNISIVSPRTGSRLFTDPEMPDGTSVLKIKCKVSPSPSSVIWYVNNEEYKVVSYPFNLSWKMKNGKHTFAAGIPGTDIRSEPVNIEVY